MPYTETEIVTKNLHWEIIENPAGYIIKNAQIANEAHKIRNARMGDPVKKQEIKDPVNTNATEGRRMADPDAGEEKAEDDEDDKEMDAILENVLTPEEADDTSPVGGGNGGGLQAPPDATSTARRRSRCRCR